VREAWREVDESTRQELQGTNGLANELGSMIGKVRILFVGATPRGEDVLRVNEELRAIEEAVERAKYRDALEVTQPNAATPDALRRALLDNTFDIVHLAGHGDSETFLLHGPNGASPMSLASLRELIGRHSTVRCVILNSCNSAADLAGPIAPLTIGMDDSIADETAIEFSRGFYDAIGAGKSFEYAVEEGKSAARMKGVIAPSIVALKSS
jgi:CHAT domain-containing protein